MTDTIILEAGRTEKNYWKDLWRYRELFYILAWRDISVRFKQTVLGVAWAIFRPLITMVIFTIVFSRLAKLQSEGAAPYAILVYAGMMPWTLFSTGLSDASNSLITNTNLITKIYFPRLIIPTAAIITAFVDFLIGLGLLFVLMLWFRFAPNWHIVFLPFFIVLALIASVGPGLWVTALNTKFRDFKHIIPFVVQVGLYISPVGFSSAIIPVKWKYLYYLNPIVGVIDGFRWCILGGNTRIDWTSVIMSLSVSIFMLIAGIRKFRSMEKSFADII